MTSLLRRLTRPHSTTIRQGFSTASAQARVNPKAASSRKSVDLDYALKPREIVENLERFIVGQVDAKHAVAVALRNRWRRLHLSGPMLSEITPRNILMIGPTGCGKTEIARRLALLAQAPFVKVEATKFTETGFHGRDVDHILRDLIEASMAMIRAQRRKQTAQHVDDLTEEKILSCLVGDDVQYKNAFRKLLREGRLEQQVITVDVPFKDDQDRIDSFKDQADIITNIKKLVSAKKTIRTEMTVAEARPILIEAESERILETGDLTADAIKLAEQNGIVFIDEIDKICTRKDSHRPSADASAEGVQRDLLPLIEGSVVNTKYGNITTDHILFIASGAFHAVKPSDLLAELQGRLPIRVELRGLDEADLYRILTEPEFNLIKQQVALLAAENLALKFSDESIREIARIANLLNRTVENIGARRLHTVIEKIVADISFNAPDYPEDQREITIDAEYVRQRLAPLITNTDLSKFVL